MPGPFAPTINANVAYESPVAPVSSAPTFLEGALGLAETAMKVYGKEQRSSRGGAGKPDPNLKVFSEELDKVAEIRATQGEMAGRLAERKVASNFAAAGIDFDKSYKAVYETKTGRQFDAYGRDDEEYQQNKLMESEEYRNIRAASFVALDPNTTEESRQTWSLNRLQEIKGAAYAVQKSKTDATYEWLTPSVGKDGEALPAIQQQYKVLLDSFSQGALAELDELTKSGIKPTAENFAQIRARFAILDRQLERPQGLQDALWKPFEDEIKEVKALIDTVESVYSVETLSETVIQDLVARVRSSKDYTEVQKNIIATNVLAKNPEVMKMLFNAGIGNKLGDFMKSLANLPMQKKVDFEVFGSDWYRKQGNGGPPDPNADTDISKIDPKILPKTDFTTEEKVRQIRGNGSFAALLDPNEATKPNSISDTANQILAMGVTMNSGNNVDFFGDELTANVTDPNILKTINGLAINNPAKGIPAKSLYRTGLKKEYSRMNQNLEAMEESLQGVTFDQATGKYVVDRKFFGKFANDLAAFEMGVKENYGGDFNRAAEDNFRAMMPTGSIGRDQVGNPMNIVAVGNFKNLSKAIKRRRNMSTILGAIDTLTEKPATGMEAPISAANEEGVVTIPSEVPLPPVRPQEDLATTRARQLQERRQIASEVLGTNIGDQRGLMQTPAYTPPETPEQPVSEDRSILQRIGEFFLGSPAAASELPPDLRNLALSYARQGRPEEVAQQVSINSEFVDSLRQSESSGRTTAQFTDKQRRSFVGLDQVGGARLTDFNKATGNKYTLNELKGDQGKQDEVALWHYNDHAENIQKRGLDRFIGQTDPKSGSEITLSGMLAVAHLGGMNGLNKYLTDEKYDRADAVGTKLSDYMTRFSGLETGAKDIPLPPRRPEVTSDAQFVSEISKELAETPTERRVREAQARQAAKEAYYRSLNQ